MHAATIGKRVGFNVWDGSNAPSDLCDWTGIVTRKFSPSGCLIEYVVKRDFDSELIKLTREYLVPLANDFDVAAKVPSRTLFSRS